MKSNLAIFSKVGDLLSDNIVNSISRYKLSMHCLETISFMHVRRHIMFIAELFLKAKTGNDIIVLQKEY